MSEQSELNLSDLSVEQLQADLNVGGHALIGLREAKEITAEADRKAYAAYKEANKDVIEAASKAKASLETAETRQRALMLELYRRTGDTKHLKAYEIRLTPTAQYEPSDIVTWMLRAPMLMALRFLTVNAKAFDEWLLGAKKSGGAIPVIPFCDPLPALVIDKPAAAILSAGLKDLPSTMKEPDAVIHVATVEEVREAIAVTVVDLDALPAPEPVTTQMEPDAIPF